MSYIDDVLTIPTTYYYYTYILYIYINNKTFERIVVKSINNGRVHARWDNIFHYYGI